MGMSECLELINKSLYDKSLIFDEKKKSLYGSLNALTPSLPSDEMQNFAANDPTSTRQHGNTMCAVNHKSLPRILLRLFQLVQMFQPRQHHLFTRLLDLARQEDLIEDSVDLVKVEDEI